jgi:hypothetical protein
MAEVESWGFANISPLVLYGYQQDVYVNPLINETQ